MSFFEEIKIKAIKKLATKSDLIKQVELKFINAEVNGLYFRKSKEDNSAQFRYSVHPSDFNFTATIKNDKLKKLTQSRFDLVVDLSSEPKIFVEFVSILNANLIISVLGKEDEKLCDLFFEFGKSEIDYIDNCVKKLNLLAKK